MQVEPEQIIIGAGTEYLHGLLIQLLGNHRIYGVENPGYHKIARIYENMKVEYAKVTLDQDGVSIRELEEKKSGCHSHITVASFPNRDRDAGQQALRIAWLGGQIAGSLYH